MATLIYQQGEEGLRCEKVDPFRLHNYLANGWYLDPECTDSGPKPEPAPDPEPDPPPEPDPEPPPPTAAGKKSRGK